MQKMKRTQRVENTCNKEGNTSDSNHCKVHPGEPRTGQREIETYKRIVFKKKRIIVSGGASDLMRKFLQIAAVAGAALLLVSFVLAPILVYESGIPWLPSLPKRVPHS
jgi:hypothetical protein